MSEKWYHGGARGLRVGDWILPPDTTGVESPSGMIGVSRTDRVYLTSNLDDAMVYAGLQSAVGGTVYEVRPSGRIEPEHPFSDIAEAAEIIAIAVEHVGVGHARKVMLRIDLEPLVGAER